MPFFFQETIGGRSKLFEQLAHQHQKLEKSFDSLCLDMDKKEEEHKRALAEEKSEVARLQRELNRVEKVKDNVKAERDRLRTDKEIIQKERDTFQKERDTLKAGLQKRAELDKQVQDAVAKSEAEVKTAKEELNAHKESSAKWLAELASVNDEMDRKLSESPLLFCALSDSHFVLPPCLIRY